MVAKTRDRDRNYVPLLLAGGTVALIWWLFSGKRAEDGILVPVPPPIIEPQPPPLPPPPYQPPPLPPPPYQPPPLPPPYQPPELPPGNWWPGIDEAIMPPALPPPDRREELPPGPEYPQLPVESTFLLPSGIPVVGMLPMPGLGQEEPEPEPTAPALPDMGWSDFDPSYANYGYTALPFTVPMPALAGGLEIPSFAPGQVSWVPGLGFAW